MMVLFLLRQGGLFLLLALSSCSGQNPLPLEEQDAMRVLHQSLNMPPTLGEGDFCLQLWVGCSNLRVTHIYLGQQELDGTIPESIGVLTALTNIYMNDNRISGSIPDTIGQLISLQNLDLSENLLTGTLPNSVGNMVFLEFLSLQNNGLSGTIPTGLEELQNLKFMRLSENKFEGAIPKLTQTMLQELLLFSNLLTGEFPEWIFNSPSLETVDLHGNLLGGTLPSHVPPNISLEFIDVHNNYFTGNLISNTSTVIFGVSTRSVHLSGGGPHEGRLELSTNWTGTEELLSVCSQGLDINTANDICSSFGYKASLGRPQEGFEPFGPSNRDIFILKFTDCLVREDSADPEDSEDSEGSEDSGAGCLFPLSQSCQSAYIICETPLNVGGAIGGLFAFGAVATVVILYTCLKADSALTLKNRCQLSAERFLTVLAICLAIVDIVFDYLVAIQFSQTHQIVWLTAAVAILLVSAVVSGIYVFSLLKPFISNLAYLPVFLLCCIFGHFGVLFVPLFLTFSGQARELQSARVARYIHVLNLPSKRDALANFIERRLNIGIMLLVVAVAESLPQALLQISAVTIIGQATLVQTISIAISVFACAGSAFIFCWSFDKLITFFFLLCFWFDIFHFFFMTSTLYSPSATYSVVFFTQNIPWLVYIWVFVLSTLFAIAFLLMLLQIPVRMYKLGNKMNFCKKILGTVICIVLAAPLSFVFTMLVQALTFSLLVYWHISLDKKAYAPSDQRNGFKDVTKNTYCWFGIRKLDQRIVEHNKRRNYTGKTIPNSNATPVLRTMPLLEVCAHEIRRIWNINLHLLLRTNIGQRITVLVKLFTVFVPFVQLYGIQSVYVYEKTPSTLRTTDVQNFLGYVTVLIFALITVLSGRFYQYKKFMESFAISRSDIISGKTMEAIEMISLRTIQDYDQDDDKSGDGDRDQRDAKSNSDGSDSDNSESGSEAYEEWRKTVGLKKGFDINKLKDEWDQESDQEDEEDGETKEDEQKLRSSEVAHLSKINAPIHTKQKSSKAYANIIGEPNDDSTDTDSEMDSDGDSQGDQNGNIDFSEV